MADVPCTLVLFTEDKFNFPIKDLIVASKQLFQFGVRDIVGKTDRVYIYLKYSPKTISLKRKFGTLPIRYMRTKIDNEAEFKTLERIVKRYKINFLDEDVETALPSPQVQPLPVMSKKLKQLEGRESLIISSDDDYEDDDDDIEKITEETLDNEADNDSGEPKMKKKKLEQPQASTSKC